MDHRVITRNKLNRGSKHDWRRRATTKIAGFESQRVNMVERGESTSLLFPLRAGSNAPNRESKFHFKTWQASVLSEPYPIQTTIHPLKMRNEKRTP